MKVILCLPTYNPKKFAKSLISSIKKQSLKPDEFLVIDSSSTDGSVDLFREAGAKIHRIPKHEFNHGATRNLFTELENGDVYIYLTQDAIPENEHAFREIISPIINDPKVGLVYGRQIPHSDAGAFGAHARNFNYPPHSRKKSMADAGELGIKTPFCSNSFAAYRGAALKDISGFPSHTILSEDMYAAAKMLQNEWSLYYAADAKVFHSHDYTVFQEFQRYFDIGVFHGREVWIRELFGKAEGEGGKYIRSELRYLLSSGKVYALPEWLIRNGMKFFGYRLGLLEKKLPEKIKKKISMCSYFWNNV